MCDEPETFSGPKSFPYTRTKCSGCGCSFEYTTALPYTPRLCWNCGMGKVDWCDDAGDVEDALYWLQDRGRDALDWFRAFAPMRRRVRPSRHRFESLDGLRSIAWTRRSGWTRDHYTYDRRTTVCTLEIPDSSATIRLSHLGFGVPCLNCLKRLA